MTAGSITAPTATVAALAAASMVSWLRWAYRCVVLNYTGQDKRVNYEEDRFITVGWLDANMTVMVWTPRGEVRRIISMRKANDREKTLYASYLE